jgi:cytochrome P450
MQLLEGFVSPSVMLFPYRVPGTPYDRLHRVGDRIEAELRGLIRERRERPDDRTDVLSLLIRAHDEDGTALTEDELVGQANVLFIAGHETMAHTLSWTLFLLARHPAVAGALREELAGGLGGSPPTVEQLARLPLLDAVVKESMRLLPATPFLFLRVAQADVQVGRYTLPRGAHLVPSPLVTHRDPAVFANPDRFQPGRWLDGLTPAPYQYLPFGAGPRMCIGAGFAAQALRVVLATLLLRVRFDLAPSAKVSRKVQGITMGPKYGLPMIVSRPNAPVPALGPLAGDIGELVAVA